MYAPLCSNDTFIDSAGAYDFTFNNFPDLSYRDAVDFVGYQYIRMISGIAGYRSVIKEKFGCRGSAVNRHFA